jgi:hypothetical protein
MEAFVASGSAPERRGFFFLRDEGGGEAARSAREEVQQ